MRLTDRQLQVLLLMIDGHNGFSVEQQLGICRDTRNNHVREIYRKLQVNSSAEMFARFYGEFYVLAKPLPALGGGSR